MAVLDEDFHVIGSKIVDIRPVNREGTEFIAGK